jgi:hypothetical protein
MTLPNTLLRDLQQSLLLMLVVGGAIATPTLATPGLSNKTDSAPTPNHLEHPNVPSLTLETHLAEAPDVAPFPMAEPSASESPLQNSEPLPAITADTAPMAESIAEDENQAAPVEQSEPESEESDSEEDGSCRRSDACRTHSSTDVN